MTRALGVDLGSVRIGLAVSDPSGVLASPLGTIERSADRPLDHQAIVDAAVEVSATTIVVGLPLSLDGSHGPAARGALEEMAAIAELARPIGIEVETYDERFSTVTAEQAMVAARVRRKQRRSRVDAAAATVFLQSWLEAHR